MPDDSFYDCPACGNSQPGQLCASTTARVCKACASRASQQLEVLPVAFSACEALLSSMPSKSVLTSTHAPYHHKIPLNLSAADTREAISCTLASWVKMVIDERGLTKIPARGVGDLVNFLRAHFDWLIGHSAASDFVDEIEGLVRQAHGAVADIPDPGPGKRVCARPDCGQDLAVEINDDNGIKVVNVRCRAGHVLDLNQPVANVPDGRHHAAPARATVPTKAAAMIAGVSEVTIRQWARRGKLTRYGPSGRAEYDVAEIIGLAAGRIKIRGDVSTPGAGGLSAAGRSR